MICIVLSTSDGCERKMTTFLKSSALLGPRFLKVAFIGRHLKDDVCHQTFVRFSTLAFLLISFLSLSGIIQTSKNWSPLERYFQGLSFERNFVFLAQLLQEIRLFKVDVCDKIFVRSSTLEFLLIYLLSPSWIIQT